MTLNALDPTRPTPARASGAMDLWSRDNRSEDWFVDLEKDPTRAWPSAAMLACFPWRGGVAEVRRGRRTASGLAVNVAKSSNQGPHVSSTGTLFPHARRGEAVCTASRLRAALQGLCGSAARATDSGASECAIHGQHTGVGQKAGERFAVWGRARRHVVVDMGGVDSKYRYMLLLLLLPPSPVHVCWMLVGIPCQDLYLRGQFFLFVCLRVRSYP
ncbi:hypothetical protein CCHR01_16460 [Colletotrichum chrysophilum]|uniref:Uncharacterized protein n=1 Tax=Colletotrichum chrysophilum TaxID=1836956 RepID=A0AAD9A3T9_9PEZI|nr:hypothetical protein CCHR01_16460 [Colletotrichum chrysophilum]